MYKPRLKGNHYDMGYHYGSLLYKKGVRLDELVSCDDHKMTFGKKSLELCRQVYPNILEEIRGMAEGLQLDADLLGTFIITAGAYSFDIGCSNLAVKSDSGVYFGRNHDMFTVLKKTSETALYRPNDGYYFLGQGDALIGKEDGVNEHGLAVGMNFVYPKSIKPGLNFLILVRMVLEKCRTTQEAIELLSSVPIMTSHNIMLADKTGHMAVVEMCCERVRVRTSEKDYITSTNHFNHPDMMAFENRPEENWFLTKDRLDCMDKVLSESNMITIEFIKDLLSSKKGNLCRYDKDLKYDTLWSFCVDLSTLSIERADGNPSKVPYKKDTRLAWAMKKKGV